MTVKYIMALLLSVQNHLDSREQVTIGRLLIGLDIFFFSSSGLAILTAFCVLYVRIKQIQRDATEIQMDDGLATHDPTHDPTRDPTHIVPVGRKTKESQPSQDFSTNRLNDKAVQDNKLFIQKRQASTYQKATILEENFERSEEQLLKIQAENAEKHRVHTQDRIAARLKVRQTKTLTKVKIFEKLKPKQIEIVLAQMSFEKRLQGDVICKQGDDAQRFYIIVTGR